MTPERWQQISRIFKSAISLDAEARAAYVAGQCGVDESLRAEVEKLIESHQKASEENFIAGNAAKAGAVLLIDENENEAKPQALNKGQQLGSYIIVDLLGAGGMGEVYLAKDSRLDRTVALKVLAQDIASDKRRMQRFRQEAKVASSLNQPNILTIFEFGEVDGLTFLATEYIDGQTLRDYLHGKKLRLSETLDITIQVLAALDAAHEAHIVHRDIKPENVMIRRRDRVVKVLDFGLAKVTEKRSSLLTDQEAVTEFKTAPGLMMGTVHYMSPEQAQAHEIDERTDIWSTGVMIYEMVSGAMPFQGATTSHTIVQILEKDPVPLGSLVKVPAELERIVLKAMAKSPEDRYQTAKDMLIDLRSLKRQLDVEAAVERTSSPNAQRITEPVEQPQSQKRVLVIALIAMAVFTVGVLAINAWRSSRATTTTTAVPATTTSVAPSVERTLTYWITVQKFKDKRPYKDPFTMAGEINFEPDYRIRVNIRSPQMGYLYVLNEGPTTESEAPEFNVVFPSSTANRSSSVVSANQVVQIPEQSWLQFDEQQGVETLWLIFSNEAVPALEPVREFANTKNQGLISDASLNKVIKNFLKSNSDPKPAPEKGETLTTLKSSRNLLIYPIKLEHH